MVLTLSKKRTDDLFRPYFDYAAFSVFVNAAIFLGRKNETEIDA